MNNKGQLEFNLGNPTENDRSSINDLLSRSHHYRQSSSYYDLMRFISRFPKYSPYNCMLLYIQNPEVTYVATPNQWQKRFQRTVKPDARPLLILAPNCPVLFVYDLADTEGKYLPERWKNPFETRGKLNQRVWNLAVENACQDGIYVDPDAKFSFLHAGTAFRLRSSNRILKDHVDEPFDFLVKVNSDQDLPARYGTLAHELGHIYSGHLGNRPDDWWKNRSNLSHQEVEIEAESISFLVCTRRGLETKSAEYLAQFAQQDIELPPVSLESILAVAYHIERMSEEKLPKRKPRKNIQSE